MGEFTNLGITGEGENPLHIVYNTYYNNIKNP
jgi:hypothetical protein